MDRMGFPFTPEVAILYNSGASVGLGQGVRWASASTTMDYPEPDLSGGVKQQLDNQATRSTSVVMAVPAVEVALASGKKSSGPCAVALEDVAATSWGQFALSGVCDVRIAGSVTVAATTKQALLCSAGNFIAVSAATAVTSTAGLHAMALEATITSGTCAAALISAFIPRSWGGQDIGAGHSTA